MRILQAVAALPDRPPVFVKVAPDLPPGALESIVQVAVECGMDGLIVSNTTVARPAGLRGRHIAEQGGLSGPPLMAPSTALLAQAWRLAGGRLALIGCGGVATGPTCWPSCGRGRSWCSFMPPSPCTARRCCRA